MVEPFVRISRAFFSRLEEFSSTAEEKLFTKDAKSKEKKKKHSGSAKLLAGGDLQWQPFVLHLLLSQRPLLACT